MSLVRLVFLDPPITFLKNPRISKSDRYSTVKLRKIKKIRKWWGGSKNTSLNTSSSRVSGLSDNNLSHANTRRPWWSFSKFVEFSFYLVVSFPRSANLNNPSTSNPKLIILDSPSPQHFSKFLLISILQCYISLSLNFKMKKKKKKWFYDEKWWR